MSTEFLGPNIYISSANNNIGLFLYYKKHGKWDIVNVKNCQFSLMKRRNLFGILLAYYWLTHQY